MDLFLFNIFITEVINSEDLYVISNQNKCALVLYALCLPYKRTWTMSVKTSSYICNAGGFADQTAP